MINQIESLKITVYQTRMLYQRYTGITFEMLSDLKVKNLKPQEKRYSIADGEGLIISVFPSGKKKWVLSYRHCKFSAFFALICFLFCTKYFAVILHYE